MAITQPADDASPYTWTQPIRDGIGRVNELTDDADSNSPKRVPVAVLGTGTADSLSFLRGDRTYADPTLLAPKVHAVGNSGSALTIDASSTSGWIKTITLNAACTFTLSGATSGRATTLELILTQDATGGRVVTWPASVKWSGGQPILSTAANAVDRIVLVTYNGGTTWYGDMIGKGYA